MKKFIKYALATCLTFLTVFPCIYAQKDSLKSTHYVVHATTFGAGHANVFETYLSPLEYTGQSIRIMHERIRMTRLMDGHVSAQNIFQINASHTKNPAKSATSYAGLVNWSYTLHYQFLLNDQLKLLFGPMFELNGGAVYNERNSNNPAQAKAYGGFGGSGMLVYKFNIRNCPFILRYQANFPLLNIMFSPEYGESYYEIFSLKNKGNHVLFTSLHNAPSIRQMVTLDFPIKQSIIRIGYVCDIQQAKVNNLKSHAYSHDFMIGFVKNLYLLKGKRKISLPIANNPF